MTDSAPALQPDQAAVLVEDGATVAPQLAEERIAFRVVWGRAEQLVELPSTTTTRELKARIHESTNIEPKEQKLLFKGKPLAGDDTTLQQAGIKQGAKLMLIGTPAQVLAATQHTLAGLPDGATPDWDAPAINEPICKQPAHAKVLAKGKPEDAMPGVVAGRQVAMPDSMVSLSGIATSHGTKVRLTMKADTRQLWIASAERTQKIPYSSISKIESYTIDDQPEYSIVSLQLSGGKLWLYWVPSQYTAALKIRIIGVHALI